MIRFVLAFALATSVAAAAFAEPSSRTVVEADGSRTLVHEVAVDAPAAEVWRAISTAEGWTGWAVPLARIADGDPDLLETSYDPAAAPGGPATIRQRLIARIPGRMLAFRTVKAPQGFPDFDTFARVLSVFELVPQGERRTLVRLTGVGYADTEAGRRLLGFFDRGNSASLDMLRSRFADGPIDWPEKLKKPLK